MPDDRRQSPDRLAFPQRRAQGRRVTDRLPLGPKAELERMYEHAHAKGGLTAAAKLLEAIAYIEALEARLEQIADQRRQAGYARAEALTPERRRQIAVQAGKRLKLVASDSDPLPFKAS